MSMSMSRRRHHRNDETAVVSPRSTFHILQTPDELKAALLRASASEERASDTLRLRTERYRTLATNLSGDTNPARPAATDLAVDSRSGAETSSAPVDLETASG